MNKPIRVTSVTVTLTWKTVLQSSTSDKEYINHIQREKMGEIENSEKQRETSEMLQNLCQIKGKELAENPTIDIAARKAI